MINIIVKKSEIFLEINTNYYYYEIMELEKEFEDIMYECGIKSNEKIHLIMDFESNDLEYYENIFKFYKLKIKKITSFVDVIKKQNKEYIYLGENQSLDIFSDKVKKIDVKISDNFDFSGLDIIYISKNNIADIFNMIKNSKTKNLKKISINYKNKAYIIVSIILIISTFIFTKIMYNDTPLDIKNKKYIEKELKLKQDFNVIKLYNKNLENEIKSNEKLKKIDEFILKKEYYSIIKNILNYSKEGIYFKNITYLDKKIVLEGVSNNYESIIKFFNDYKIEYLLSVEDNIGFKISKEL